jgi:G3E family GTPase
MLAALHGGPPIAEPSLLRHSSLLLRRHCRTDDLAAWLDNLAGALGDRLLRLKGLVRAAQNIRPVLVQSVGTAFSLPRPLGEPDSATPLFLVIIARDLEDAELDGVQPLGLFGFLPGPNPRTYLAQARFNRPRWSGFEVATA